MRRVLPFVLLSVVACAHAHQETAAAAAPVPGPQTRAAPAQRAAPAPSASSPVACRSDEGCAANQLCLESRCVAIGATTAACDAISTHFDFDAATLRSEDLPALQRAARCAQALPKGTERIEGNCDDRGTTEYNLALGAQRAAAAKKYLVELGVPASRIKTLSYGKEKPRCSEETDACWAMNRRDDVVKAK